MLTPFGVRALRIGERELDAAGITDPRLRAAYERCRRINAEYGRTYFLATQLLPPAKRPAVHALYAFARYADEIVDDIDGSDSAAGRSARLRTWGAAFLADLAEGSSEDPVCAAVIDTVRRWHIPVAHFEAFLDSMATDLTVTEFATYSDLQGYMYGSAAVIGLEMLPILGASSPAVYGPAQALGYAFQLANFIRDVGEDLDRGRLYLPIEDLARFGLERADLERRTVDDRVRELLAYEIARVRRLDATAREGIRLLDATSQPCVDAARRLYCGIVDEVERIDYQVFDRRATVPRTRRAEVAVPAWIRAVRARRRG
jgi:15-cis-phytoene synthase